MVVSISIRSLDVDKCECGWADKCGLTELGDPIASSLSLFIVFDEPPGIRVRCVSIDVDGCVSALVDVLYVGLLAAGADQLNTPGRHCGPC